MTTSKVRASASARLTRIGEWPIRLWRWFFDALAEAFDPDVGLPWVRRLMPATPAEEPVSRFPAQRTLWRQVEVPANGFASIARIASLEVRVHSPFPAEDTAWGYRVRRQGAAGFLVRIAICRRSAVTAWLQSMQVPVSSVDQVWVVAGDTASAAVPVRLREEVAPSQRSRTRFYWSWQGFWLLAAVALVTASQWYPVMLSGAQLRAMVEHERQLTSQAEPAAMLRREIEGLQEVETLLAQINADAVQTIEVLARLTEAIDDESWVEGFQADARAVRVTGYSANAATVLEGLNRAGLADVRLAAPAVRDQRTGLERFIIELSP